jgi:hypothetical protein
MVIAAHFILGICSDRPIAALSPPNGLRTVVWFELRTQLHGRRPPMSALATATATAFRPARSTLHTPRLRLCPTPLEALEGAIDLDNIPRIRLQHGLDRLMHDIESFQDPERWDGMS